MSSVVAVFAVAAYPGSIAAKLPPGTLHGNAYELDMYPTVSLATATEKAAARRAPQAAAGRFRPLAGHQRRSGRRLLDANPSAPAGRSRGSLLPCRTTPGPPSFDVNKPKAIIYANAPGRPLVLVGVMFAMPRGKHGPTPGGPITRWHTHTVCIDGDARGTPPRKDGSCPPGSRKRQGSEMMHMWLTGDLRSAFAIHAPEHELCLAGMLPEANCDHSTHHG